MNQENYLLQLNFAFSILLFKLIENTYIHIHI
jgi:hypothetical protein